MRLGSAAYLSIGILTSFRHSVQEASEFLTFGKPRMCFRANHTCDDRSPIQQYVDDLFVRRDGSHELEEFFDLNLSVADNLPQQSSTDVLSRMDRDNRVPPIRVPQEHMAPSLSHNDESKGLEGLKHLAGRQRDQARHGSDLNGLDPDERDALRDDFPRA